MPLYWYMEYVTTLTVKVGLAIQVYGSGLCQPDQPDYTIEFSTNPTRLLIGSKPVIGTRLAYYSGYPTQTRRTRLLNIVASMMLVHSNHSMAKEEFSKNTL
jgi:hypothetical protein